MKPSYGFGMSGFAYGTHLLSPFLGSIPQIPYEKQMDNRNMSLCKDTTRCRTYPGQFRW